MLYICRTLYWKIKVGDDQKTAQSERNSHSKNRGGKHIAHVGRMSSYFPIGGHSVYVYRNLTKI